MHTRGFKALLPLPWVNGCDSTKGMSNAFTNTQPVSPHRAWYTDNLNVCSPLIIPFTTSLYWIIHLHTSDWDQQQKGLVCGCTSISVGWGLITYVSWVGTKHELEVERGLLSSWRLNLKGKGNARGGWETQRNRYLRHACCFTINSLHYFALSTLTSTLRLNRAY